MPFVRYVRCDWLARSIVRIRQPTRYASPSPHSGRRAASSQGAEAQQVTHPHLMPVLNRNLTDESFMVDEASMISTHQRFRVDNEDDMSR